MDSNHFFTKLAEETDIFESDLQEAPARLKSRIYSTLVAHLAATGPLLSLTETQKAGRWA